MDTKYPTLQADFENQAADKVTPKKDHIVSVNEAYPGTAQF